MAKTFVGYRTSSRPVRQPRVEVPTRVPLRIRPFRGGYSSALSPDQLPQDYMTYMSGLQYDADRLCRGEAGSAETTFDDVPVYLYPYRPPGGEEELMVITTKELYHHKPSDGSTTLVSPTPAADLVDTAGSHFQAIVFNDVFYFTDLANPLRQWPGTGNHTAVATGYAARTMMALNNHILLSNIIDTGTHFEHDTVWSQNFGGTVSFAGTGSGRRSHLDTPGAILAMRAASPLLGYIWKEDSLIEARATGDINVPFEWVERSRSRSAGLWLSDSIVNYHGEFFYVAIDGQVYMFNGSSFNSIGEDIRRDLQGYLFLSDKDKCFGVFDDFTREYIIMLNRFGDDACAVGFGYQVDRKRWRHIELPTAHEGITHRASFRSSAGFFSNLSRMYFTTHTTKSLLSGEHSQWSPALILDPGGSFDGEDVDMVFQTADFVGPEDGQEATLLEVSLAVLAQLDNAEGFWVVQASVDEGRTWVTGVPAPSVDVGGLVTHQLSFSFLLTGMKFRLQVTEFSDQDIRLSGLTLYFAPSSASRATKAKK